LYLIDPIFLAEPLPSPPSLTHLTFSGFLPSHLPNLTTSCPHLTYLLLGLLKHTNPIFITSLANVVTSSLTHFSTHFGGLTAGVCLALPNHLTWLSAGITTGREVAAIRGRWFPPVAARGRRACSIRLASLRLLRGASPTRRGNGLLTTRRSREPSCTHSCGWGAWSRWSGGPTTIGC